MDIIFVNLGNIKSCRIVIIDSLNYHYLSIEKRVRWNFTQLQFDLLDIPTIFLIEVEQPHVLLSQLGILALVHIDDPSDKSLSVQDWEAKLVELVHSQLLLENVLKELKMQVKTDSAARSSEVQEIIRYYLCQGLYCHNTLFVIETRDLVDTVIEDYSLHGLRFSRDV